MKKLCLKLIHFYQRNISPLMKPHCRYYPTCSQYTYTAISNFGIFKGIIMGTARILRCNPFIKGGYDPVPKHFTIFRNKNYK